MLIESKHCIKTLATALFISAFSINATADINPGNVSSGSGELFLSVWDQTKLSSYSLDLGVTVDSLLKQTSNTFLTTNSIDLGSGFSTMYKKGDILEFNIAASNVYPGTTSPYYGFIVSHQVGGTALPSNIAAGIVFSDAGKIQTWAGILNTAAEHQNNSPAGFYSANLSEVSVYGSGSAGNSSYYGTYWTKTLNGIIGNGSATAHDNGTTSQALELAFYGDTAVANNSSILGTNFQISLNADSNTLSWTGTPVPAPEEWTLMLLGLSMVGWLARSKAGSGQLV